jgi:phosphate transport system ATP-binding protein
MMNAATNPTNSAEDQTMHTEQHESYAIQTEDLNLWYGTFQALFDVNLKIRSGHITSLIGPSGCGKSTFLRSVNRINERLGYVRIDGSIKVLDQNIYDPSCELVQVRKQIGMVFQRPNPLPLPIRDNVLFGVHGLVFRRSCRVGRGIHHPNLPSM